MSGDLQASSFFSVFWDYYVAIIALVSVVGCGIFLWMQSRRKILARTEGTPGPAAGDPATTGHVWDGDLQEFNNPMPRWWIVMFYITVVFSLLYLALYPGLGTEWKGMFKWSSTGQYDGEVKLAQEKYGPMFEAFAKEPIEQLAGNPKAIVIGQRIFLNNCAQCHGSDARGSRGFPNLSDGDWMYGGAPETLVTTITGGRIGVMPPMGAALGGKVAVEDVANYVLSLSGSAHNSAKAVKGKEKFDTVCAACHGIDGKGNQALGAVNLTDKTWLYGGSLATVTETINGGRTNVMPSFKQILSGPEIHLVAAYVWSLSHQPAAPAAAPVAKP
ncbi:MAG: cytochrome-c oxidase, cbb3-type subunit III [Burkholderiaceae bacterium]